MPLLGTCRCGGALLLAWFALPLPASAYLTSEATTRNFSWSPAVRSLAEAFEDAFPPEDEDHPWEDLHFNDNAGVVITKDVLLDWVETKLLNGSDPFAAHSGKVPVPWPSTVGLEDQLSPGHWVAYTRRQVCHIVAKSLVGAGTEGYLNGLVRYLEKVSNGGCQARTGDFGRSFWVLLGACAADPSLAAGGQGPLLVVAKASAPPEVATVREMSNSVNLTKAGLRVCQYDDGVGEIEIEGAERVPAAGCAQPSEEGVGKDFMTGGLPGQAVQDISARFLGGYVFGYACGLGGGQDERLMTYMPEVAVLTFFLSQSNYRGGDEHPHPQLRQPAWILGARMLFAGLDGTARFDRMLIRDRAAPLTSDLVQVVLSSKEYNISSSKPFIAFMSENQGFFNEGPGNNLTLLARQNLLPAQRDVNPSSGHAFGNQVRAWYASMALTSYNSEVRPLLRTLVKSIGTGPWLAGLWWGDGQLGLLSVWLGHALAAMTWDSNGNNKPLPLDYYLYSAFTENPGNQCLVHSGDSCRACLNHCYENPLPASSYWLPDWAYFGDRENLISSCVPKNTPCGTRGLQDVIAQYATESVYRLWMDVELALTASGGLTSSSVFDLMLGSRRRLLI